MTIPTDKPGVYAVEPGTQEEHEKQQATESRKALVKDLTAEIRKAREFWNPVFEQMRKDMAFASGDQWDDNEDKMSDKYQVNFVQRELNQEVSSIYAKNPTATCKRKKRLEYQVWDGEAESLAKAKDAIGEALQSGGQPPVEALAIYQDFKKGQERKRTVDRMAETLELIWEHEAEEQSPDFESQMKDLILREKTTAVGFVTVKFRRENESPVVSSATQASVVERLEKILQLSKAVVSDDPNHNKDSATAEDLKLMVLALAKSVQDGEAKVLSEGLVLDFKPSTSVIVHPKCRNLIGFVGADWVTEEFMMSPAAVEAQWKVNVKAAGQGTIQYQHGVEAQNTVSLKTTAGGSEKNTGKGEWADDSEVCVWLMYHKVKQLTYVICDGYDDFLEEPCSPWPAVKGFWPILALKLNRLEIEENKPTTGVTIYGKSAVSLMRPMQQEMNRSQEALREHRFANRPGHTCGKDTFTNNDRTALAKRAAHDVIPLDNVPPGADTSKALNPIATIEIDPALYRTDGLMQHVMLAVGSQQANLGQQAANEKATGQAIAEQSRIQSASSEVDSIDKFLSDLVRVAGEMALQEMSTKTVEAIVGPGAAWPTTQEGRAAVRNHLFLSIEAGSTGRPNKQVEVSNLREMMPQMIELAREEGLPMDPLVKHAAKVMEFDFDLDEWLAQRQPKQQGGEGASESISIKLADLTPEERAQALAMAGIHPSAQPPPPPQGTAAATPVNAGASLPAQAQRMLPK
jgi:hypothetical protein